MEKEIFEMIPDLLTSKLNPIIPSLEGLEKRFSKISNSQAYPMNCYNSISETESDGLIILSISKEKEHHIRGYRFNLISMSMTEESLNWENLKNACMLIHANEDLYEDGYEMRLISQFRDVYIIWLYHPNPEYKSFFYFSFHERHPLSQNYSPEIRYEEEDYHDLCKKIEAKNETEK